MQATSEQQVVVKHRKGHAKVAAVAGSGKSTTMVLRIETLIKTGFYPGQIKVLMFNASARDEFKEKLTKLLKPSSFKDMPQIDTFHGHGSKLINYLVKQDMLPKYRLVTTPSEQKRFMRGIIDDFVHKGYKVNKRTVYDDFATYIDLIKSGISVDPKKALEELELDEKYAFFTQAYEQHEEKRHKEELRFFADLIYDPMVLLATNEEARKKAEKAFNFKQLIVDEYQDVNDIQQEMIRTIAAKDCSVMVVGDADQCIYAWRGAKPEYILNLFDNDFPGATHYQLTRSFRYGHRSSMAANYVITHNELRDDKLCISSDTAPDTQLSLEIVSFKDPNVPSIAKKWTVSSENRKLQDIAVLLRTFSFSVPIEVALLREGISYRMEGGKPLFENEEIGSLVAALNIAAGKVTAKLSFLDLNLYVDRFLNYPPTGMGYSKVGEFKQLISQDVDNAVSILRVASTNEELKTYVRKRIAEKVNLWENLDCMSDLTITEVIDQFMEMAKVEEYIERTSPTVEHAEDKLQLFDGFRRYAEIKEKEGLSLKMFVDHIDELKNAALKQDSEDSILITSVHRSKGLEWPLVIMPELWEGGFPYIPREKSKQVSMEDERRLFYVAMTRAKELLVMITPADKQLNKWLSEGRSGHPSDIEKSTVRASRFLYESNLYLAQQAPNFLSTGTVPSVASPEIATRYLQESLAE